jgi:RNA polymerase sigma factor for flagellar operon FliA
MIEQISELRQACDSIHGPATPEVLAEKLGWTESQVLETLEATRFSQPHEWTDLSAEVVRVKGESDQSPDRELETQELKARMADWIEQLPEKERLVLVMYYTEDLTLQEIGSVIGLSESRVSRLLASAKFRLKEMIEHGDQ